MFLHTFACLFLFLFLFISLYLSTILICLLYWNANFKKKISIIKQTNKTKKKLNHIICRFYKVEVYCVQINWSVHLNWMWQQFGYRKVKMKTKRNSFLSLFLSLYFSATLLHSVATAIKFFACQCSLLFLSVIFHFHPFQTNGYAFGTCYIRSLTHSFASCTNYSFVQHHRHHHHYHHSVIEVLV